MRPFCGCQFREARTSQVFNFMLGRFSIKDTLHGLQKTPSSKDEFQVSSKVKS
jgi:hypothetical protein